MKRELKAELKRLRDNKLLYANNKEKELIKQFNYLNWEIKELS